MSDVPGNALTLEDMMDGIEASYPVVEVSRPDTRDPSAYKEAPIVGTKAFGGAINAPIMARWFYLFLIDGGEHFVIFKTERINDVWGFHRTPFPDDYKNLLPEMRQNNLYWQIVYIMKKYKPAF